MKSSKEILIEKLSAQLFNKGKVIIYDNYIAKDFSKFLNSVKILHQLEDKGGNPLAPEMQVFTKV